MEGMIGLVCPICRSCHFAIKYEAAFVYSYIIDSNAPGLNNNDEFLPFLFDRREQKQTQQYIECTICGSKYPCYFNHWDNNISIQTLQNAISIDNLQDIEAETLDTQP